MSQLAAAHRRKARMQLSTRLWPIERMVSDSIAFIQKHELPEGYFIGFSGGKDSIVTLRLVQMSGVKHSTYYSATGIDPPEVMKFIKRHYPEVTWLRPKYSFWEGIMRKSPPFRVSRWCCDVLKKNPSKKIKLKHRILGLRAEESAARRSRPMVDQYKGNGNQCIYKPIFNWLEWHVWEFIERQNLPYPSLYDEGFHRIGCVVCPFMSGANLRNHKQRWPKQYKTFEHAVRRWWDETKAERSTPMLIQYNITTPDEFLRFWYNEKTPCTCPSNDCAGI